MTNNTCWIHNNAPMPCADCADITELLKAAGLKRRVPYMGDWATRRTPKYLRAHIEVLLERGEISEREAYEMLRESIDRENYDAQY